MPSMKIMEHVQHILRILAGVGLCFLAYYFGVYLLDWKSSEGDAFVLMVMVLCGVAKKWVGQYDTPENRAQKTMELEEAARAWQLNHPPRVTALKIECGLNEEV